MARWKPPDPWVEREAYAQIDRGMEKYGLPSLALLAPFLQQLHHRHHSHRRQSDTARQSAEKAGRPLLREDAPRTLKILAYNTPGSQ